jgi:putative Holliday junction resolvase
MTTAAASKQLAKAGRNTRRQRQVIDQAAAVALLETALHSERLTGRPAGELMQSNDGRTPAR